MAANKYFTESTIGFLKDLKKNNNREWFAKNKSRYEEQLKDPALQLIADCAPECTKISPHFMATPRSLFRIYRDTRFSRDKTPYKTHAGIHFRHDQSKDVHAPGFYLHIEPGSVFAGIGVWHPDAVALKKIRDHIVEEPDAWKRASQAKRFKKTFELEGDRLKRPPKGFDPNHPLIEELKWKDYLGVSRLPQSFATSPTLPKELFKIFAAGTLFMRFLCEALGVPF